MKLRIGALSVFIALGCAPQRDIAIPDPASSAGTGDANGIPTDSESSAGDQSTKGDGSMPPDMNTPAPNPDPLQAGEADILPKTKLAQLPEFPGVHAAAATLQSYYSFNSGLWPDGWWHSASALTALIDYMELSGSREYLSSIDNSFEKNKANSFISSSYDETAWWGLAWIRAYELTKNPKYLEMARAIADSLSNNAWDNTCDGGLYKKSDKLQKSAATNLVFMRLTAALHKNLTGDTRYLQSSENTWRWLKNSGLLQKDSLVQETISATCQLSNGPTWSMNQGLILSALNALYQAKGDKSLLVEAKTLAYASIKSLSNSNGIILERNSSNCGSCTGDERLYKGIYTRGLRELNTVLQDPELESLLAKNSESLWSKARSDYESFGFRWEGPFDSSDTSRQVAALDLLNSRIPLKARSNLSYKKAVTARAPCAANEGVENLLDSSVATKFCSSNENGTNIDIDLGETKTISQIRILHAGAGGEQTLWNTDSFEIFLSNTQGGAWIKNAAVTGNKSNATVHMINQSARFLRVHITKGGADNMVRIYDITAE